VAQVVAQIASSEIDTVEFLLNNQSLGFKNTQPYVMNFEVPDRMGRHTLTIKAANKAGLKSEKSIPITVSREEFSEAEMPFISGVDINFRTLSLTFTLPNFAELEAAQVVVSQPENILYQETFTDLNKFKYVFVPSTGVRGQVDIELYTKTRGEADFVKADSSNVRY
jgi:hypothetical protein